LAGNCINPKELPIWLLVEFYRKGKPQRVIVP
jgi:hypothetical protein